MKKPSLIISAKNKPEMPIDLGEKASQAITASINPLIADIFALYVKTKNFHWHVSGTHYRDYHLLFDEQADQIFAMIDVLAERVRKLGGTTIRSISHIQKLQSLSDDNESNLTAHEMIKRLMHDNKLVLTTLRKTHRVCDSYEDIATASLIENFVDETERRIWFLFETSSR